MSVKSDIAKARKIKAAYTLAVESSIDKLTTWIDTVSEENPGRAVELVARLTEYVLPKLSKDEIIMKEEEIEFDYSKLSDDELKLLTELMDKCRITS